MATNPKVPFKMLHSRVLLRYEEYKGLLQLPEMAGRPKEMIVVAVGPGAFSKHYIKNDGTAVVLREPMSVKVGDRVLGVYGGTAYKYDGVDYVLCLDEDLAMILPEDAK